MSLALRFISGRYQGGEFPLEQGREVLLGRSSDLDMVLVEEMVSRRHARILWTGDDISIEDLGSTNGTFVNGEKIDARTIQEGDRILIGTSILKLVPASQNAQAATGDIEYVRRPDTPPEREGPPRMTGSLSEVPLPDLLQLFAASRKTGVLLVAAGGQHGHLYLKDGDLCYARIEGRTALAPEKAVFRMLAWEDGHFQLDPPNAEEFDDPLTLSMQEMLMEGFRQQDEMSQLTERLPEDTARLSLPAPLTLPLRDLKPEELDGVQACLNARTFGAALDASADSDLATARMILTLIERGYLVHE